ncbi:MAG: hypothetical protein MN733_17325 [Nitrososphaera sp.]|nr:hypothetical protein [Nitrososphaera sp.]
MAFLPIFKLYRLTGNRWGISHQPSAISYQLSAISYGCGCDKVGAWFYSSIQQATVGGT